MDSGGTFEHAESIVHGLRKAKYETEQRVARWGRRQVPLPEQKSVLVVRRGE